MSVADFLLHHSILSYLPNHMDEMARYNHKAFCGVYSADGNVFLSAAQGTLR